MGWYRVSGFLDRIAETDVQRTRTMITRAKTALRKKKRTPIMPIASGGAPNIPVKKRRRTALVKLTAG
jgi:hypothetical protein